MYYTFGTPSPGREKGTTRENVYACLRVSARRTIQEEYFAHSRKRDVECCGSTRMHYLYQSGHRAGSEIALVFGRVLRDARLDTIRSSMRRNGDQPVTLWLVNSARVRELRMVEDRGLKMRAENGLA